MGQLIACKAKDGVLIASDSGAVHFEPDGEEKLLSGEHLFPINQFAVAAFAGAVEGAELCRDFVDFVKGEALEDFDALAGAAVPFFTGRYDEFMRKVCELLPLEPLLNLYFLLAGYNKQKPDDPGRLLVMWNRVQPPKIDVERQVKIFTLPRRMGLEMKLNQMVSRGAMVADLVTAARAGMEKLATKDEYIKPPYRFMSITAAGVKEA